MNKGPLILSLFPGIDGLGLGFQREWPEACIVRGPDLIFGSLHDIRNFHPPRGAFQGIFAGPPCQCFSRFRHLNPHAGQKHGNMIPEFERVVFEAQPDWFVMENVPAAPEPHVEGYIVNSLLLNNRWLGELQNRVRRFSFGTRDGRRLDVEVALFEAPLVELAVTSSQCRVPVRLGGNGKVKKTFVSGGYTIARMCELQGLPPDFLSEAPFTAQGKRQVIGDAVPLPMGRAIAKAVRKAMEQ